MKKLNKWGYEIVGEYSNESRVKWKHLMTRDYNTSNYSSNGDAM